MTDAIRAKTDAQLAGDLECAQAALTLAQHRVDRLLSLYAALEYETHRRRFKDDMTPAPLGDYIKLMKQALETLTGKPPP